MGCTSSIYAIGKKKKKKANMQEVVVFVPSMRIPVELDLQRTLRGILPHDIVDRLSAVRSQIVLIAEDTGLLFLTSIESFFFPVMQLFIFLEGKGKSLNVAGGSALPQLQRALEDYLPVLLGLTIKDQGLEDLVEFKWKNLEDGRQEASLASSWFELLSVLHMMAILLFSEANSLLIPKDQMDACERNVSEDCKKDAIDLLLKASGCLEFCIRNIVAHLPPNVKNRLPGDLQDNALEAISIQALGQGTEMLLGLAVESQKATLSVKRRLACEQLSYFAQAHCLLSGCNVTYGYGKKHILFIKWKYLEAKAAAYYYNGLILDKGNELSSHISAVCCYLAAEELLTDSKKACLSFCLAAPVTRVPPVWGVMKHLHRKIPEVASRKSQMYGYLLDQEKALQALPDLPDFPVSLRPDEYKLPEIDPTWDSKKWETHAQILKGRLKDGEYEMEVE